MKTLFYRILSVVLLLALLCSALPFSAAAATKTDEEKLIQALVDAVEPTNKILSSRTYNPIPIATLSFDPDTLTADVMILDTEKRAIKMLEVPFLKELFSYKEIYSLQIGEDLIDYESLTQFQIMLAVGHNTIGQDMTIDEFYGWLGSLAETLTISAMDGHDVDITITGRSDHDDPDTEYSVTIKLRIYNRYHKITWKLNNGEADYVRDKVEVGASIARPNPSAPAGMKFYRWDPEVPATMGTSDLTFNAVWIPTDHAGYEVRHRLQTPDLNDYELVETEYLSGKIGSSILGSSKAKVFDGFALGALPDNSRTYVVTEDGNMKINLYYDRVNVRITWEFYNGAKKLNRNVKYGLMPVPPAAPTPPDDGRTYVFVRWDRELLPATEPTTYRARYADDKMLVLTLDANGGEVSTSALYLYIDDTFADLPTPTREGYSFLGWYYENGDPVDPSRVVDAEGAETVVAHWKVKQYTIYFDTDGAGEIDPITLDYGALITPPADPEKEGCLFLGWSPLLPYTMPARILFVTAQWHVHNIVIDEAVAATCTTSGLTAGEHCTSCDYKVEQLVVPALGHDFQPGAVATPSCTEGGYTLYVCSRCGQTEQRDPTEALDHSWNEGKVTTPATATTAGVMTYTCIRCDATKTEVIPATGGAGCAHTSTHNEHQDASCTEAGYDRTVCDDCELVLSETVLPALNHDYVNYAAQPATCTEIGWNAYHRCSRCGDTNYVEIPALKHDYVNHAAKPATCTEAGWNAYQTCSRCDYSTYKEIAALGHDVVIDAAVPASCTASGLTAGEHCTRCDYKVAQAPVSALGHDYVVSSVNEATCTEPGSALYACTRCTSRYSETIDPLGHDLENFAGKAPTCTEPGWADYQVCTRCDYTTYHALTKLGHSFKTTVVAPTCTERGYTFYECTRCDYTEKGSWTAPLGHGHVHPERKEPTCTEAGYERAICDDCGNVVSETVLPALGHDLVVDAAVPATCTNAGLTAGSHCSRCDYKVAQEVVPALGHTWDAGKVTTPATATTDGVKTFTCTRCGVTRTEVIPATGEEDKPCDGGKDCPSYAFRDVNYGDWYHEAVDFAVKRGLFKGMTDTTFEPNTAMTRGMLVTVLYRYDGEHKDGRNTFTDVKASDWFADAVAWAAEHGIVTGVGNNRFDPNGRITREQMAAILYRYSAYKNYDTDKRGNLNAFPDAAKVSSYARDAYAWAVGEGLITGNKLGGQTLLDPQGNATRAQVATILMRFIRNIAE